jgi:cell division protein FtsI (penicillin-binding protein 3)
VYGGTVAGPVFRDVGKWALSNMRVNPELQIAETIKAPSQDEPESPDMPVLIEDANLLPDFRGQTMREVLKKGKDLGLHILLEGSGMAVKQDPGPGSPLDGITSVKVSFRPPA